MGRKSRVKKHRQPNLQQSNRWEKPFDAEKGLHGSYSEPSSIKNYLFAIALSAAVFLAYKPAWSGEFIFDDDLHLLNNPVLKTGGLVRAWSPSTSHINYWPLTFTVYRLEFDAWGLNPLGFHLVNIALHSGIALLVWRVLVELNAPGAMLAAAIFALHPVNVESVAWIAQLKGLLSLLFALVSALFYLQYDRSGGSWRYATAITAYGMSTLAKGMVITLPVVLLALAWWRRGRLERRDFVRLVPFMLIGALMAGIEVWAQGEVQTDDVVRSDNLLSRTAVAGYAVWFYFGKMLWPFNLCFVYPRWNVEDGNVLPYLPGLVLLVILFALALWRRRTWGRPVVMFIVCYVGLLLPALGFANIYFMRYSLVADHYQYAAAIVPCAMLTGGAVAWALRQPRRRSAAFVVGVAILTALTVMTWRQSRMYVGLVTLYQTTIDRNPNCWLAYSNLGSEMLKRGLVDEAIADFRKAMEIKPDHWESHYDLGLVLIDRGQIDEAIVHYRKALEFKPHHADLHNNLGAALASRGKMEEAIAHYQKALEIKPNHAMAHYNLGVALASREKTEEAMVHYRKALEIKPDYAMAHYNLGVALVSRELYDEAIGHYQEALKIQPDFAEAHYNLGVAYYNLGSAFARRGKVGDAIANYQKALDLASARNDMALADRIRTEIAKLRP